MSEQEQILSRLNGNVGLVVIIYECKKDAKKSPSIEIWVMKAANELDSAAAAT